MKTIKALSVKQPYAGLIIAGIKTIENRSWFTRYAGRLAICASKKPETSYTFRLMRKKCARLGLPFPEQLCAINGACLGTVTISGQIYRDDKGREVIFHPGAGEFDLERAREWWNTKLLGWILSDPQQAEPFPVSGRLGLFNIEI